MRQHEKQSSNRQSRFLKTRPRKLSFRFLNFDVGLVRFLENRYPTFLSCSDEIHVKGAIDDAAHFCITIA